MVAIYQMTKFIKFSFFMIHSWCMFGEASIFVIKTKKDRQTDCWIDRQTREKAITFCSLEVLLEWIQFLYDINHSAHTKQLRNECLFSRFMGNESQCGTNKSREPRSEVRNSNFPQKSGTWPYFQKRQYACHTTSIPSAGPPSAPLSNQNADRKTRTTRIERWPWHC